MNAGPDTKQRNLTVLRGQGLTPRVKSPEELLDAEIRDAVLAMRRPDGRIVSRATYKIQECEQHPGRILARRISEALEAGVLPHLVWNAYVEPLRRYYERKRGEHTQTHRRAS